MRNLKRALSLTLASVMLLGMMVVGASAKGYPDVSEDDNVEAIEVLQAVQVMRGDDNGDFNPDSPVTRSEMAVIMALLLNYDYQYYEESCPFWDVPTWARGYVGVCYVRGIVAGYSDNTYGAADSVTAVQAAAMMMRALGYFQYDSDYADGFETATVRQGTRIGIFKGVNSNATEPLTRNQVAQMALNALKTPIVEPDDNTINIIDGNGNLIASGGQVNYVVVASNQSYARAIDRTEYVGLGLNQVTGYTVELGEQLYDGMLKLNDDIDAFKRPARAWEYNGKAIGLYAKEELLVYENVGEVTGKVLYDLLGKSILDNYDLSVALDGVDDPSVVRAINGYDTAGGKNNVDFVFEAADINRSNNGSLGATGTGVLTQVYVNPEKEEVHIAVINTYLARASQDYDTRREELVLNAYSVVKYKDDYVKVDKSGDSLQIRLGVDEFPLVESAKENDAFLVTFAEGEVQSAVPAEVLSGVTVSSFKVKDNVVVNGTTYKFTTTAGFDAEALKAYTGGELVNLKDTTYNIFLDAYGNLIGVQEVDAVKNYVFITAIDLNDSNLVNGTANAKAIFLDGTVDTIQVNMDKSTLNYYTDGAAPGGFNKNSILNTWCTFTKTNSDVYTVKQVSDVTGKVNEGDYVPGGAMNGSNLAQYHQHGFATDYAINTKYITLQGRSTSVGDTYSRVLGNENTVYLTAELTNLTNQGGTWGVIKGVDTVTTGAENVNLNVWTDAQAVAEAETDTVKLGGSDSPVSTDYASKGVYTLYNDNGIIIATVVVGEDDGTARNLVYVHSSSVNYEAYNGSSSSRASGDDMWTWTRNVISNGKEITLTEVSDGNSDLAAMNQYHWYQIKANGDGEVTGVYRLADDTSEVNQAHLNLPVARLERYDDYALRYERSAATDNIGEIAYTVQNGSNTVLYWNQKYIESWLNMDGRTLYVATDDQTGFIVNSNVNWVVQQWDNNRKETYIDEGTTAAGLKSMIDEINRRNTNLDGEIEPYKYQVSAIIEGGIASSVVIYYNENDYARPGSGTTTTPSGSDDVTLTLVNGVWTLTRNDGGKVDGLTISEIQNLLLKAGCTNVSMTGNSWNFTFDGITCTGVPVTVVKGEGDDSNPEEKPEYAVNVEISPVDGGTVEYPTSAKEGEEVNIEATPADGYVLDDIQLDGVSLDTSSFTMPGHAVNVVVTFKAEPITGVSFTGSAEQDTDFTTGPKAEDGSFTIKAVNGALGVKVYGEEGCTVAPVASTVTAINDEAYTTWTVTPEEGAENVVVRVNKMRAQFTGSALVSVEVTDEAGGSMRMARTVTAYADGDAEGENLYFKVTFLGLTVNGEQDPTYTVAKVPGKQGLWFGADFGEDEAAALLEALNGFSGDSLDLGLNNEVTDEEIDAWLGESVGEEVNLTLAGSLFIDGESLKSGTKVYNGEDGTYLYSEDKLSTGVTFYTKVNAGNKITIKGGSNAFNSHTGNTYVISGVTVKVVDATTIEFEMPSEDFVFDSAEMKAANEVLVVTVKDGIQAYVKADETELKQGENVVTKGSVIVITDTGTGTNVITDAFVTSSENVYDDTNNKEIGGEEGIAAATTLYSAIEVEVSDGIDAFVNGVNLAEVPEEEDGEEDSVLYVALGTRMNFRNSAIEEQEEEEVEYASFDGFLVNAKGGNALTGNAWVVSGSAKATIYGAYTVRLDGVTATYGTANTALTSGQVVAKGETVKTSAPAGSAVVDYVSNQLAYNAEHADGAITGALNLASATKVNIYFGALTGWGQTEACVTKPTDQREEPEALSEEEVETTEPASTDKVIYVLPNTYVSVSGVGEETKINPVVYEDGVKMSGADAVDNVVVFKVGSKAIEIRLSEQEAVDATTKLISDIRTAIGESEEGDIGFITPTGTMITAEGNLHYLGKPYNDDDKTPYDHSVAKELKIFLDNLHDAGCEEEQTSGIYEVVKYNGVEYTYHRAAEDGYDATGYWDEAKHVTLISVLVTDSAKAFPTYQAGEWTVELSVNGLSLTFKVIIYETYGWPKVVEEGEE